MTPDDAAKPAHAGDLRRPARDPHRAARGDYAGNGRWVAGSAARLVNGWVSPAALGYAFVIAQAAAVVRLAELEYIGLRKASRSEGDAPPAGDATGVVDSARADSTTVR
jgi:hypothetical protein